jgi:ABC-type nitrate/sulfonate/bicarbonate transport system permease component
VTLLEAFYGLLTGIAVAFLAATLMDSFRVLYRALYPLLVVNPRPSPPRHRAAAHPLDGL